MNKFFFQQRPLEVTRRFVENRDGTFDLYNAPKENTVDSLYGKQPIRPFELKTYLKVGKQLKSEYSFEQLNFYKFYSPYYIFSYSPYYTYYIFTKLYMV